MSRRDVCVASTIRSRPIGLPNLSVLNLASIQTRPAPPTHFPILPNELTEFIMMITMQKDGPTAVELWAAVCSVYSLTREICNEQTFWRQVLERKEWLPNEVYFGNTPEQKRDYKAFFLLMHRVVLALTTAESLEKAVQYIDGEEIRGVATMPALWSAVLERKKWLKAVDFVRMPEQDLRVVFLYMLDLEESCRNAVLDLRSDMTTLPDGMFLECNTLTALTLPKKIKVLGQDTFAWCESLHTLTLPPTLETIGDEAFNGCVSLRALTLPPTLTTIGRSAFVGCKELTTTALPRRLTSIGAYAFSGCEALTTMTLPEQLKELGDGVFSGCKSLWNVNARSNSQLTTIPRETFDGCTRLTALTLPRRLTIIGDHAFAGCEALTGLRLPQTLKTIEDEAFRECTSLTALTLPEQLTTIGMGAFRECTRLMLPSGLPETLVTIGRSAFYKCDGLQSNKALRAKIIQLHPDAFAKPRSFI